MAYLETVPSEISAFKYANEVSSRIWFKRIYLGGHSKGDRLAASAAKGLFNKEELKPTLLLTVHASNKLHINL